MRSRRCWTLGVASPAGSSFSAWLRRPIRIPPGAVVAEPCRHRAGDHDLGALNGSRRSRSRRRREDRGGLIVLTGARPRRKPRWRRAPAMPIPSVRRNAAARSQRKGDGPRRSTGASTAGTPASGGTWLGAGRALMAAANSSSSSSASRSVSSSRSFIAERQPRARSSLSSGVTVRLSMDGLGLHGLLRRGQR